jgi:hypothetical protein
MAGPALAGQVTLDAFTDPFPPNPCLPDNPPLISTGGCSYAHQTGLPGVFGGAFRDGVVDSYDCTVTARVRDDVHRFEVSWTGGTNWRGAALRYGSGEGSMNLNWDALGVTQLTMVFGGDISPTVPLWTWVEMITLLGPPGALILETAVLELPVTKPGPLVFPFSEFNVEAGFSFADVDEVRISFHDCPQAVGNCASDVSGTWWLGPIRGESGVVETRAGSWGRLKTLYR